MILKPGEQSVHVTSAGLFEQLEKFVDECSAEGEPHHQGFSKAAAVAVME